MCVISVRHATTDDMESIVSIYVAAFRTGFQHMFRSTVFTSEQFHAERLQECQDAVFADNCDTLVAEHDGRVAGFAVARPERKITVIDDIWVHPSSWGSGAAAALVARIEDDMRSRGGYELSAWVPEDSPTGQHFFRKIGWQASGEIDRLEIYPHDPNRLIEYVRVVQSMDLTRGLPRPTRSLERAQVRPPSLTT